MAVLSLYDSTTFYDFYASDQAVTAAEGKIIWQNK